MFTSGENGRSQQRTAFTSKNSRSQQIPTVHKAENGRTQQRTAAHNLERSFITVNGRSQP